MDSRAGDFDSLDDQEDEILSMGSDASRLKRLEIELEKNSVTFAEKYNEMKVKEGTQVRLEDAEILENLQQDEVLEEQKTVHEQQLLATQEREERAKRTLTILNIRESIIESRERSKKLEMEAELRMKRPEIQRNQMMLDQKRQKLEMKKLMEEGK